MSHTRPTLISTAFAIAVMIALVVAPVSAQWTPLKRGSDNIEVLGHLPVGPALSVSDTDVEQELSRPYAYMSRMAYGGEGPMGLDIISIEDPTHPEIIYEWRIADRDLHLGNGGMDVKHFKVNGRYYVVQSTQFGQGGPRLGHGSGGSRRARPARSLNGA